MEEVGALPGRAQALRLLRDAVAAAGRGTGDFIALEGEAGIGKTALTDAAAALAQDRGLVVCRGRARQMQRHRPFGVVADALALHPAATDGQRGEVADLLGGNGAVPDAPDAWAATQFRTEEALLAQLDELTRDAPLALVLDDLHWADPASIILLDRLARTSDSRPMLVLVTARPLPRSRDLAGMLAARGVRRLEVGPLGEDDVRQVVAEVLGAPPGDRLMSRLEVAGGNPLFLREMLASAVREGAVRYDAGVAEVDDLQPLPSFLISVLDTLTFLSAETLDLLRVAAVLGSTFTLDVLGAVSGRPVGALWPALEEAFRARLLEEHDGGVAFRHDLIRQACYEDLPLAVRQAMHADAAVALEAAGATATTVAEHVMVSTGAHGTAAAERLRRAAADATNAGAPAVAVDLLGAALKALPPDSPTRTAANADLGLALLASGRPVDGDAVLRDVLAHGVAPDQEADVRAALQQGLVVQGRLVEALAAAEEGAASPALSARDRARFRARASMGKLFLGDVGGALATAHEAERAAVAAGDAAAEVRAVLTRAHVAGARGDVEEAAELATYAVGLAVRNPSVEAFASLPHHVHAMALTEADDMGGAIAAAEAAQQAGMRLGVADSQVMGQIAQGQAQFHSGRWDDALAALETAVALAEETGTAWQIEARCLAALLHAAQGRRLVAEGLVARAADDVAEGLPAFRVHWVSWVRAVLADDAGHPEDAVALLLPAWQGSLAHGVRSDLRLFGPLLARATAATGRPGDADAIASTLEEHADQNPGVAGLAATARRARGLATGDADVLLEALALHAEVPRVHERARCAEETALALLGAGRAREARGAAEQAVAAYSLLHAEGELARCRSALRAAGLRLGVRGPRRRPASGWAALTATEAEVARLVAARLSNPEIAEQMFLSRRTVGHHVSHVLAKLHMTSRVELAAAAARGPLEDL